MKNIVEDGGKYYAEEVTRGEEVTQEGLESDLVDLIAQKEADLARQAAEYDALIADLQRQIDELIALKGA